MSTADTDICIVGGGPAGMMLGYLLARSEINVVVLEKHRDFMRDFRGDTVQPSTLEVLRECGLIKKFNAIPQYHIQNAAIHVGDEVLPLIDYHGLKPFDYIALVPQWDFLNLLAEESRKLNTFQLLTNHEVTELIKEEGVVVGVKATTGSGNRTKTIRASLTVGCDGRRSTVRKSLGLNVHNLGAPMDVLWFKLPRKSTDSGGFEALLGAGHMMIMINRRDYWQIAYVVPKGSVEALRKQPISKFRQRVVSLAPILEGRCEAIESWDDVKTLVVSVDRLERWHAPGALVIGDAAHAMSPIGGVGINLAIQDAVAAGNVIAGALRDGHTLNEKILARVQKSRNWPTKLIQAIQLVIQKRVISSTLEHSGDLPKIPGFVRWLSRFRRARNMPAKIFGYGFGREHVNTSYFRQQEDAS